MWMVLTNTARTECMVVHRQCYKIMVYTGCSSVKIDRVMLVWFGPRSQKCAQGFFVLVLRVRSFCAHIFVLLFGCRICVVLFVFVGVSDAVYLLLCVVVLCGLMFYVSPFVCLLCFFCVVHMPRVILICFLCVCVYLFIVVSLL